MFVYVIGFGKVIVLMFYIYVQEMFLDGRGVFVEFEDVQLIVDGILMFLKDESFRKEIERKILEIGKEMYWYNVVKRMIDIFYDVVEINKKGGVIV